MNPIFGNNTFKKAAGFEEVRRVRRFGTKDIVKRLGVITPKHVVLRNYPVENPTAIFNAAVVVERGDVVNIVARIVMGYFLYVSAIVSLKIPLPEVLDGSFAKRTYEAEIVLYPSTKYDIWGAEDPRVYGFDDRLLMTYTGRTAEYFRPAAAWERTLPVTAVREGGSWRRAFVHVLPAELRRHVISDKDAFLARLGGEAVFLHRPHMDDNYQYLAASVVREELLRFDGLKEVEGRGTTWVMPHASFEEKLGWSAPLTKQGNSLIALAHGVDNNIEVYRALAVKLSYSRSDGFTVEAVTPHYIMEPREPSELFGDRPYTIFPCGAWVVDGDKALVTYGAGDYMVGVGIIDVNELLSELDKGRVF